jgi:tRNA nucleotidyltransferase/poly(A) polymerase
MPQIYKVGGVVRDKLLGLESKDIDFVFVLDNLEQTVEEGFQQMTDYLKENGYYIFLSVPEMYTIRAKFPKNHIYRGLDADFVMARKEVGYVEGTRRPILALGTLYDDLLRRDFTINAMAQDLDGTIIDPFGGQEDLRNKTLRTPQSVQKSFDDDPLRILRAIRFAITKDMNIGMGMWNVIESYDYNEKMGVVSTERIREELYKCFKYDTVQTLWYLSKFKSLTQYIFENGSLWLEPTMKKR